MSLTGEPTACFRIASLENEMSTLVNFFRTSSTLKNNRTYVKLAINGEEGDKDLKACNEDESSTPNMNRAYQLPKTGPKDHLDNFKNSKKSTNFGEVDTFAIAIHGGAKPQRIQVLESGKDGGDCSAQRKDSKRKGFSAIDLHGGLKTSTGWKRVHLQCCSVQSKHGRGGECGGMDRKSEGTTAAVEESSRVGAGTQTTKHVLKTMEN
ncbi:hypothetical protein R3P38DRAFT_2763599 [Favolaschia claudopus]|uniref:Uncharacterized protein n=1 Tax=Favolaschia claudopus TaxID=2862362 RepID=A0AAW0DJE5_9AGAR